LCGHRSVFSSPPGRQNVSPPRIFFHEPSDDSVRAPSGSRSPYASHWRDLLDDKPVPPEISDEESDEDEEENEQDTNEQEENNTQDQGDASSEMSFDSGVLHAVQSLIEVYGIRNDVERVFKAPPQQQLEHEPQESLQQEESE
jgi:hypothetical protein